MSVICTSVDVVDDDPTPFDALPNAVVVGVDVLPTIVEHWVLGEDDGRHVVHPDLRRCNLHSDVVVGRRANQMPCHTTTATVMYSAS
jgi:hypothetical protein